MSTSPWPGVGSGRSAISRCLYCESKRAFTASAVPFSKRNSPLPRNKIVLSEQLRFCPSFAAGHLNHPLKNHFAHLLDAGLTSDDPTRVDIDDVSHALREGRIGRNLQNGRNRIPRRRAQSCRKENDIRPSSHLRRDGFHVTPRCALQVQSRLRAVLWIVDSGGNRRCAAFLRCSRGFHCVRQQSIPDIAGRRIHFETRTHCLRASRVISHKVRKTVRNFFADAAINELLFHAAEFGKFREKTEASERGVYVGDVPDGRIRREPGKTIGPAALEAKRKFR